MNIVDYLLYRPFNFLFNLLSVLNTCLDIGNVSGIVLFELQNLD